MTEICVNINAEGGKGMGKVERRVWRKKDRHVGQVKSVAAFSVVTEMF